MIWSCLKEHGRQSYRAIAFPVPFQSTPAQANSAGAAVIGACSANPAACAIVVGAAGTWVLWNNGTKFYCTTYQCQRTNQTPREFRISDDETNTRGVREVHMAMSPAHCDAMLKRFQAQGLRLTLRKKPNPMPGARKMTLCIGVVA
jgi:hypothetical protein